MRARLITLTIVAALATAILQFHVISIDRARVADARHRIANGALRLVVLGDSVAHGAGDESGRGISGDLARLTGAHTSNLGINGARTKDVARLLGSNGAAAAVRVADAVVVSVGGNDLFGDRISKLESMLYPAMMMDRTIWRIDRLVRQIRELNPDTRVYLLGLYDPYRHSSLSAFLDRQVALWDSRLIAHFAADSDVDVIRIADLFVYARRLSTVDHFHPGQEGYKLIAQRIAMTW